MTVSVNGLPPAACATASFTSFLKIAASFPRAAPLTCPPWSLTHSAGRMPGGSPRPPPFPLPGCASDEKHATVRLLGRRPGPHPGGRPAAGRSPLRALPRRRPGRPAQPRSWRVTW